MTQVALAFGSNMGDRLALLRGAIRQLAAADDVRIVAVSHVYETSPVGGPDQPDYLNAVALIDTALSPYALLDLVHEIESALGRVRDERWGPRSIDIDIIVFGDLVSGDERLMLPHPRAAERAFVLVPWLDVDPDAALPGGETVTELVAQIDQSDVRRRSDLVLEVPS